MSSGTSTVVVAPVQTKKDYQDFVDLPWRVPFDRPGVRPLREFERHLFDRGRRFRGNWSPTAMIDVMLFGKENPYYEHGDLEMFLARDSSGRPVARIVALENRLHNESNHDRVGFFGFYQCIDSGAVGREATSALTTAAMSWLKGRGLESIRGPFNPTINDECGIWTEGDSPPAFLMPSNPRWYADHLVAAGFSTAKTLRVYRLNFERDLPEEKWSRWSKMLERIYRSNPNLHIRSANFKDLSNEVKAFVSIFNLAWAKNWGFAPMSYKELYSLAELFQYMVDPSLIRAAEVVENGVTKIVGVMITLPDLNEFFRYSNGALFHPAMIWNLIRMKTGRPTKRIRIAILGVLPEYRNTPVSLSLLVDSFVVAKKFGAKEIEASWIVEDNRPMVKPLEDQNFKITDTYKIYEQPV